MKLFYATVRFDSVSDEQVIAHKFPPLKVWHTYCCKSSECVGTIQNVVILVEANSRKEAKKQVKARRIRANEPSGGWASLYRNGIYVQVC